MSQVGLAQEDLEALKAIHREATGSAPRGPKAKDVEWLYEKVSQLAPDAVARYMAERGGGGAAAAAASAAASAPGAAAVRSSGGGPAGCLAGVVVSTSQIQGAARTALFAFVVEHGGEASSRLDARCTHLVLCEASGSKYRFARQHRIHTVAPEFVAECVESGQRAAEARHAVGSRLPDDARPSTTLSAPKVAAAAAPKAAAAAAPKAAAPVDGAAPADFLHEAGAVIYVGDSFDRAARDVIKGEIERAGGRSVLKHRPASKYTHALCAHRSDSYFRDGMDGEAGSQRAAVSSLWWQACVEARAVVEPGSMRCYRPAGSSGSVHGMQDVKCSVTGLVGDARKDVREMLQLVGAEFSGAMRRGETTHLICEQASGAKYDKAMEWGITVVRASWLQAVFERWKQVAETDYLLVVGGTTGVEKPAKAMAAASVAPAGDGDGAELVVTQPQKRGREASQSSQEDGRRKKKKKRADNQRSENSAGDGTEYVPCDDDEAGFFFLLSGGKSAQRQYISQIQAVDAELLEAGAVASERAVVHQPRSHSFDERCTHIVMPGLKRTQKYLCGVAGGVWLLKPSFLTAAQQLGSFSAVDPKEHEWYGTGVLAIPNSSGIWRGANRHWRVAGSREKNKETPFGGLHMQIWGRTQVQRKLLADMVRAGGGQLLGQQSASERQDDGEDAESDTETMEVDELHLGPTDLVVLGRHPKQTELLARLAADGVPCVREAWVIEKICVDPDISRTRSRHSWEVRQAQQDD